LWSAIHRFPFYFRYFKSCQFTFSLPTNSFVKIDHLRSQPSSCEEEVRNIIGHKGQGVLSALFSGGLDNNSICVTEAALYDD
jgi:hypothetical protein